MKLEVQRQGNNKWRAWNAITLYITTFDFCYTFFLDFDLNKIKFYCSLIQSSCLNQFSAQGGIFKRWVNMKIQWNRNLSEFEISDRKVIFISYSGFLKCQTRVKQVDTQLQRYCSLPNQSNGVSWNTSVKFYVMLRTSKLHS